MGEASRKGRLTTFFGIQPAVPSRGWAGVQQQALHLQRKFGRDKMHLEEHPLSKLVSVQFNISLKNYIVSS